MKNILLVTFSLFSMLVLTPASRATDMDAGLYDPQAPEGSAFVRFLNLTHEPAVASLNGKGFGALSGHTFSPYYVTPKGSAHLILGTAEGDFNLSPGSYYTFSGTALLEDEKNEDRSKAQIFLYNFSAQSGLSLKTADGNTGIIGPVETGKNGMRKINAVAVNTGLFSDDKKIEDLPPVSLERGQSYSVVVFPDSIGAWILAKTDTTR